MAVNRTVVENGVRSADAAGEEPKENGQGAEAQREEPAESAASEGIG
jgi:hypothetical protein